MNNKRNRRIALVIAVLMLTMAFSSTGFAAWMGKTMEAQYRNITIWVNSELKQARNVNGVVVEPFIVDGTTYVPLRGISQMLGYEVNFNPATYRIDITGTGTDSSLQYQLYLKDARIAELEAQLADQSGDLSVIEKDLLEDYDYIGDVYVEDITLKGDEDDIEVGIFVDLYYDQDEWDDLRDRDIEYYLQDIVDELLKSFRDADITGYIEDEDSKKELIEFSIDKYDDVVLGSGSSSGDISDLEDELNNDYDRVSGVRFTIEVTEKSGKNLFVELTTTNSDVIEAIEKDDMENYLEVIYDVIVSYDDFDDYVIYGDIIDRIGPIEFDYNNNGSVNLIW